PAGTSRALALSAAVRPQPQTRRCSSASGRRCLCGSHHAPALTAAPHSPASRKHSSALLPPARAFAPAAGTRASAPPTPSTVSAALLSPLCAMRMATLPTGPAWAGSSWLLDFAHQISRAPVGQSLHVTHASSSWTPLHECWLLPRASSHQQDSRARL